MMTFSIRHLRSDLKGEGYEKNVTFCEKKLSFL
jgi:hypothetical protein